MIADLSGNGAQVNKCFQKDQLGCSPLAIRTAWVPAASPPTSTCPHPGGSSSAARSISTEITRGCIASGHGEPETVIRRAAAVRAGVARQNDEEDKFYWTVGVEGRPGG